MPHLVVLDAMGLAYRAYYAFISRPLVNSRGENTSAIVGFANSVLKVRREEKPDYWALAWDGPGPTFRHERFAAYKATRKPMPAAVAPGGLMLLTDTFPEPSRPRPEAEHNRMRALERYRALIEPAGFEVRAVTPTHVLLNRELGPWRFLNRLPALLLALDRAMLGLGLGRGDPAVNKLLVARRAR